MAFILPGNESLHYSFVLLRHYDYLKKKDPHFVQSILCIAISSNRFQTCCFMTFLEQSLNSRPRENNLKCLKWSVTTFFAINFSILKFVLFINMDLNNFSGLCSKREQITKRGKLASGHQAFENGLSISSTSKKMLACTCQPK